MTRVRTLFMASALAAAVALLSCGRAPGTADAERTGRAAVNPAELIAAGKVHLVNQRFLPAREAFQAVLDRDPNNTDALMGVSLTQYQQWLATIDMLVARFLDNNFAGRSQLKRTVLKFDDIAKEPLITPFLQNLINDLRRQSAAQTERLAKLRAAGDAVNFTLDRFEFRINRRVFFSIHREWDAADVLMLSGIQRLIDGGLAWFDAHDLNAPVEKYFPALTDATEAVGGVTGVAAGNTGQIGNVALRLLVDSPAFLTFRPGAADTYAFVRDNYKAALNDIKAAFDKARAETDDQSDDVVFIKDADGAELRRGLVTHWGVHGEFRDGAPEVWLLWKGTTLSFIDSLLRAIANAEGKADNRLRLDNDVFMLVGMLVDFIAKGVGLADLAGELGVNAGGDLLNLFGSDPVGSGEATPRLLVSLSSQLGVPRGAVEFDPGAFLSRPMPLRDFFPARGIDPLTGADVFLQSFECARLGFAAAEHAVGTPVGVVMSDHLVSGTAPARLLAIIPPAAEGETPRIIDVEPVTLTERAAVKGWFDGTLPTARADTAVRENGTLEVPAGATIVAQYDDGTQGGDPIRVEALIAADGTTADVPAYETLCKPETSRDERHFAGPLWAEAVIIADPPGPLTKNKPYTVEEPDGWPAVGAYAAFPSASSNGLMWLNVQALMGDRFNPRRFRVGFQPADASSFRVFLDKVSAAGQRAGAGVGLPGVGGGK